MNRFLRLSSSLALCALLAVPAAAGAARDDFDLSASGISSSGYAQQLGAPKSYGSGKITLKMPKENPVAEGVNPITGEFNFAVTEGYLVRNGQICEPVRGATLIGKGSEILMDIDMVGQNLDMGQGMCGSASGSIPTNVGQPLIRVSSITVGGR